MNLNTIKRKGLHHQKHLHSRSKAGCLRCDSHHHIM